MIDKWINTQAETDKHRQIERRKKKREGEWESGREREIGMSHVGCIIIVSTYMYI